MAFKLARICPAKASWISKTSISFNVSPTWIQIKKLEIKQIWSFSWKRWKFSDVKLKFAPYPLASELHRQVTEEVGQLDLVLHTGNLSDRLLVYNLSLLRNLPSLSVTQMRHLWGTKNCLQTGVKKKNTMELLHVNVMSDTDSLFVSFEFRATKCSPYINCFLRPPTHISTLIVLASY